MERYFHERPAVWLGIGALLGAFVFALLPLFVLVPLAAAAVLSGAVLLARAKSAFSLPLAFGLVLFSSLLLPVMPAEGVTELSGRVISAEAGRDGRTEAVLDRAVIGGKRLRGTVKVSALLLEPLETGDGLAGRAYFTPAETLSASLLLGTAEAAEPLKVTPRGGFSPYVLALRCRETLESVAERLFSPYAGEADGMLLGDRSGMAYLNYKAYQNSGLLHLLCVSGLHVGIVAGAVLKLVRGTKKGLRLLVTALVLLVYTALTGFSASSLRAALMLFLLRLTMSLERQKDALSALGLSFACLLIFNPLYIGDAGFLLSFGAVYGLLTMTEPLSALLPRRGGELFSLFAGSMAATLGTLPVSAAFFGSVQWAGVLLSAAAIPVAPFFLIPGWLCLLLYFVSPRLARLFALLPKGVLVYLDRVTHLGSFGAVSLPAPGPLVSVLWYAGLFFLSGYFLPNKKQPRYIGCLQLFLALGIWLLKACL